jgi:hypothetical protein
VVRITSNADALAAKYRDMHAKLDAALERGLLNAMSAVEEQAQANLSGQGAPFSYPVPVRTGNLRGQLGAAQITPTAAEVFDTADYAWAVHEGVFNQWAGRGKTRRVEKLARPFLTDALAEAKPTDIILDELERTVFA